MARAAVACAERVLRLTFADALAGLEVDGGADGGDFDAEEVRLRVGVHTGDAIGGLIGSKAPRYSLHGDAVRTSIALCRNGVPGTANVSDAARRMACVA
ncbi:hypothetical protein DFJ73DRAFT_871317 [Zopfochytrium polystomum]|nr:hypothetical protein DFJ73DRAFT_871317 [Zopfochytrium polystomum]